MGEVSNVIRMMRFECNVIRVIWRCGHMYTTYAPTFAKSCEIFIAYFYDHEMTLCQVSGFLDLIQYLFYFFTMSRKYSSKMLKNSKIWKRSSFLRELTLSGSNEHVFEKTSQNNEKSIRSSSNQEVVVECSATSLKMCPFVNNIYTNFCQFL